MRMLRYRFTTAVQNSIVSFCFIGFRYVNFRLVTAQQSPFPSSSRYFNYICEYLPGRFGGLVRVAANQRFAWRRVYLWGAAISCVSLLLSACDAKNTPADPPSLSQPPQVILPSDDLQAVSDLRPNAPVEEITAVLDSVLPQLYQLSGSEFHRGMEVIEFLRSQPRAVEALAARYTSLSAIEYDQRMFTVQILGELRRVDALPHLESISWAKLPEDEGIAEGLSARDFETMIQVHAVNGIAYLRTDESNAIVLRLIQEHEARSVRIGAIDAYMWNHDDDPAVAKQLYAQLPTDLHPYVEMPRVHRDMDPLEFKRKLAEWRERWGANE